MRVLIGCEFSGMVREQFRALGHDAFSCDLLPAADGSPHHYRGDVLAVALHAGPWDLGIFHPPCTYLTLAGVRWLYKGGRGQVKDPARWEALAEAARFFRAILALPIARKAVENPIPHRYALELIGRRYSQIVQPFHFGHRETKATCLWLDGLPALVPTRRLSGPMVPRVHHEPPGPDRWRRRSILPVGMCRAFARQWAGPA